MGGIGTGFFEGRVFLSGYRPRQYALKFRRSPANLTKPLRLEIHNEGQH